MAHRFKGNKVGGSCHGQSSPGIAQENQAQGPALLRAAYRGLRGSKSLEGTDNFANHRPQLAPKTP